MKKIETILQFLDKKGIKPATFEREMEAGNGYLDKTVKRNADVSYKFIEKLRKNKPEWYNEMFELDIKNPAGYKPPESISLEDRAVITILLSELAKLQAVVFHRDVIDCMRELEQNTRIQAEKMKRES